MHWIALAVCCHSLALAEGPTITAFVGTGEKGYTGDGGPAAKAKLDNPFDVVFDPYGNLYLSDTNNHCVRRVDAKTRIITTIAGNGKKGYTGDGGPATQATFNEPYGIKLDQAGNLFIVDRLNFCIRMVSAQDGTIRTIAGTGASGYSGDGGPAHKAQLREPNGICFDPDGKLYIADVRDQRVRVVEFPADLSRAVIRTAVGNGKKATAGDGGPIAQATLNGPRAVIWTPAGKLLIVEREGNCVRQVDFGKGVIERYAGTGKKGYSGDGGAAREATFDGPKEIDVDAMGNVFIVDTENEAIRRIDAKSGIVTTIAGKGRTKTPGQGDNGPAIQATLGRPHGVAVGPDGGVYIGDTLSHRIRLVLE